MANRGGSPYKAGPKERKRRTTKLKHKVTDFEDCLPPVKKAKKAGQSQKEFLVCSQCGSWKLSLCRDTSEEDVHKQTVAATRVDQQQQCKCCSSRRDCPCCRRRKHAVQPVVRCGHHHRGKRSRGASGRRCVEHECVSNISYESSISYGTSVETSENVECTAKEVVAEESAETCINLQNKPKRTQTKKRQAKKNRNSESDNKASSETSGNAEFKTVAAVKPKRKVGRPKKFVEEEDDAPKPASTAQPRKVGRPKKSKKLTTCNEKPIQQLVQLQNTPAIPTDEESVDLFDIFSRNTQLLQICQQPKTKEVEKKKEQRRKAYKRRAAARKTKKSKAKPKETDANDSKVAATLVDAATCTANQQSSIEKPCTELTENQEACIFLKGFQTISGVSPVPRPPTPISFPAKVCHVSPIVRSVEPRETSDTATVNSVSEDQAGDFQSAVTPTTTSERIARPENVEEKHSLLSSPVGGNAALSDEASIQAPQERTTRRSPRLAGSASSPGQQAPHRASLSEGSGLSNQRIGSPVAVDGLPNIETEEEISYEFANQISGELLFPDADTKSDTSSYDPTPTTSECVEVDKKSSNGMDEEGSPSSRSCPQQPMLESMTERRGYCSESPKLVMSMNYM